MITYLLAAVLAGGLLAGDSGKPVVTDAAVAAAARGMRIQIYETFREDRPEYDRRQQAWEQVKKAWDAAGSPAGEREKFIRWCVDVESHSRGDSIEAMPEAPKFTSAAIAEDGNESMEWLKILAEEVEGRSSGVSANSKPTAASAGNGPAPVSPAIGTTPDDHRSAPKVNVTAFIRNLLNSDGSAREPSRGK
jgi:hypothetical protein